MATKNFILTAFAVLFLLIFIAGFMYAVIDIEAYNKFCKLIFGGHPDHSEQDLGFVLPFFSLFLAACCWAFSGENK